MQNHTNCVAKQQIDEIHTAGDRTAIPLLPKKLATRVDMLNTYISRSPIEFFGDMVYFAELQKLNAQEMVRELER